MPRHEKHAAKVVPDLEELLDQDSKSSRQTLVGNDFELDKQKIYKSNAKSSHHKGHEPPKEHKDGKKHHDDHKDHHEHEEHKGKGHHAKENHSHHGNSKGKHHKPSEVDDSRRTSVDGSSGGSSDKHHKKGKHYKDSDDKHHKSKKGSSSDSHDKSPSPVAQKRSTAVSFNPTVSAAHIPFDLSQSEPALVNNDPLSGAIFNPIFQNPDAGNVDATHPDLDPASHFDAIFNHEDPFGTPQPPSQPDPLHHPPGHPDLTHHAAGHLDSTHHPPGHPDLTSHPPGHPDAIHHPPGHPDTVHHPPGHPDAIHHAPDHLLAHHHPPGHPNAGPHLAPHHATGTGDHIGAPVHHPGAANRPAGHANANRQGAPHVRDVFVLTSGNELGSDPQAGGELQNPEEGIITKHEEGFHVVLLRRFGLLTIVVLIMIIDVVGILTWGFIQHIFGAPPTYYSEESYTNTLMAMVSLFIVCLLSIIILRAKIHHSGIGYFLMFTYGVTLYVAMKGASRAHISIKYDDIATIEKYIFTNASHRSGGSLPDFFHRIQSNFECCGTTLIDKMEDWPVRLATKDMPNSCCKKVSAHCGESLASTYKYDGRNKGAYRTPSGFFLALTAEEMSNVISKGRPIKIIRAPGNDGLQTVLKILGEFYFKKLKQAYPPGTPLSAMQRLQNDIITPADIPEGALPASMGCRDDSAPEKPTIVGWEIQLELDKETSKEHIQEEKITYDWMAWKIPVCKEATGIPPYYLASNLNRGETAKDIKHMWYISRGITENYILKDLLWEIYCENEQNQKFIPFTPNLGRKWQHPSVGRFYIAFVNQLMFICFCYSISVIVSLVIVFLIFWHYYSKMKLEEFANLPYPQEFDVLEVRQDELYIKHDKHEYDKSAQFDKPKKSQVGPEEKRATKGDLVQGTNLLIGSTSFKNKVGNVATVSSQPQPPPEQSHIENLFGDEGAHTRFSDPFGSLNPSLSSQFDSLITPSNPAIDSPSIQAMFGATASPTTAIPSPKDETHAPPKATGGDHHRHSIGGDHHRKSVGGDHHRKSVGGDHSKSVGGGHHRKSVGDHRK